jgi:putative SOS response-associated peptidase YedK
MGRHGAWATNRGPHVLAVCNLYSELKSQTAVRQWARALHDRTGNLPPLPAIFPDMMAPIVRKAPDGERELVMLRWGLPSPPAFVRGIDRGVTNIRNLTSPHWRGWLGQFNRCVVPATSFCEPSTNPDPSSGKKIWTWFALAEDRPLFCFAGIWRSWYGVRGAKAEPVEGRHELFGFLTTEPNAEVQAVHEQAMPVILRTADEIDLWMNAPISEAIALQRPLPDDTLMIVGRGLQEDGGLGLLP